MDFTRVWMTEGSTQVGPTVIMEGGWSTHWGWMNLWWLCPCRLSGELFTEINKTLLTEPVPTVCQCTYWFPRNCPICATLPILLRHSGTSSMLFRIRLGTVALASYSSAVAHDKTDWDLTRITLMQEGVHESLNRLHFDDCWQKNVSVITMEKLCS